MGDLLKCPVDGTVLVLMADSGIVDTVCHDCRREFRFVKGPVTFSETRIGVPEPHLVTVDLLVDAGDENVEIHDTLRRAGWPGVAKGPAAIVLQTAPSGERQLLQIESSDGTRIRPREPGDRAAIHTVGVSIQGAVAVIFTTILTVYFYHWLFALVVPLFGGAVVTGLAIWRWRKHSTRQKIERTRLLHLEREQWLLGQLYKYRLQSAEVDSRLLRYEEQIKELKNLADQMRNATGDYEQRLSVVERGLSSLKHHVDNDHRLKKTIDETMQMVEIEYRASRALEHLPDDAIDRLTQTVAELDAIESENMLLEAELEANAEVNSIAPA